MSDTYNVFVTFKTTAPYTESDLETLRGMLNEFLYVQDGDLVDDSVTVKCVDGDTDYILTEDQEFNVFRKVASQGTINVAITVDSKSGDELIDTGMIPLYAPEA